MERKYLKVKMMINITINVVISTISKELLSQKKKKYFEYKIYYNKQNIFDVSYYNYQYHY